MTNKPANMFAPSGYINWNYHSLTLQEVKDIYKDEYHPMLLHIQSKCGYIIQLKP